jgi:hypothetical protein
MWYAVDRAMAELRLTGNSLAQNLRSQQRLLAYGRGDGLEFIVDQQVEAGVDPILRLEVIEEGLPERHAELHRAYMFAVIVNRNDTARTETGHATLEPAGRPLLLVGDNHGMAE